MAFSLSAAGDPVAERATEKLWSKGVQAVVGNSVDALGSDTTEVLVVTSEAQKAVTGSKAEVSKALVLEFFRLMSTR